MIEWYRDNKLAIKFDIRPDVRMRYALPSMDIKEKESIRKYPFINCRDLNVELHDFINGKKYDFVIPKNYCWDGASIPRIFWRLIGTKTDPAFLIPSLIHDVLCEHHNYVENNRYFANKIFERLLYVSGVSDFSRWLMFHSVDNWQKFCKWEK